MIYIASGVYHLIFLISFRLPKYSFSHSVCMRGMLMNYLPLILQDAPMHQQRPPYFSQDEQVAELQRI